MDEATDNLQLHFISEIWTNEKSPLHIEMQDRVQMSATKKFHFLDTKTSWYPEEDLEIGFHRKKVNQLKFDGKDITPKPGTLHDIPLCIPNYLVKITP